MGNYLTAIWRCRYFWLSLVKNDLRTRYRRSVLGNRIGTAPSIVRLVNNDLMSELDQFPGDPTKEMRVAVIPA